MLKNNIIANYLGKFYTITIGIVVFPLYLNYLGAEAYGLVGFFTMLMSWMMLLDMGMAPTLSREVAKLRGIDTASEKQKFKYLLHSMEFIFILIGFLVFSFVLAFNDWITMNWLKIDKLEVSTVSFSITLIGFMMGLRFLSTLYKSGIIGAESQVWLNVTNMGIATVRFVGVLFIFKFISVDVKYFFAYQVFISILEFLLLFVKFYKLVDIGKFKLYFSYKAIRPIVPFALGITYSSIIWIFMTQLDKFLLSSILSLENYGYFAIVVIIANAIRQLSNPISKAILPRMTKLHVQNKDKEMIRLYKKSTQLMAVFIFSVSGIIAVYSYELLYSLTGNQEASTWAKDILFWYAIGNGIIAISLFQYYIQFAYGELKMHVQYNTVLAIISIPLTIWVAYNYGAVGVSFVWFLLNMISFLIWTPIVHSKFVPGLHKDWMLKDVLPIFISSVLFFTILNYIDIDFELSRFLIFIKLFSIGVSLLLINILTSSEGRKIVLNFIKHKKGEI